MILVFWNITHVGHSEILVYNNDYPLPDEGTADHAHNPDELHEDDAA